jgi:SnoaL-like domain
MWGPAWRKHAVTTIATIASAVSSGTGLTQDIGVIGREAAAATADQRARKADQDLVEVARRYLEACVTRDADYLAANSIDDPQGSFSGINSSPGPGRGLPDSVAHFRELPRVKWSGLSPEGFVAGDFAWFTDYAKGVLPSGQELDIRVTLLMRRVDNAWKTVHYHVSEGLARKL